MSAAVVGRKATFMPAESIKFAIIDWVMMKLAEHQFQSPNTQWTALCHGAKEQSRIKYSPDDRVAAISSTLAD